MRTVGVAGWGVVGVRVVRFSPPPPLPVPSPGLRPGPPPALNGPCPQTPDGLKESGGLDGAGGSGVGVPCQEFQREA
ncbi:hypothetical protein CNQ36_24825 [Streptomyces fungicidicus]|uniref:Uncharacterized protein n=1 Tax=Streptomyces fungicidicus TaxID=68203 RepID=A0A494USG1_9ACTN|nr:hypothetical protein CNQ36_24825 [Streptomyces fungicidicus]